MSRFLVVILFLGLTALGWSHDPLMSGIGLVIGDGKTVVAVQAHLSALKGESPSTAIPARLDLSLDGVPYQATESQVTVDAVSQVAFWTSVVPHEVAKAQVGHRLFPENSESRTVVSVTRHGQPVQETLLDAHHSAMAWGEGSVQGPAQVVAQFLRLGVFHIFTGPDHILFILGLILLGGGLKPLMKTVTAFTLAHSITLTIAALGIWSPPSRIVEPLIALSIVAVAFENLRKRTQNGRDWRPWIAFAFGLIHGFGFAGGLTEAGVPAGSLGWALASFNVGVEAAQATIVLATVPLLSLLAAKRPQVSRWVVAGGSCAIALAGAFWFVDRLHPETTPESPTYTRS